VLNCHHGTAHRMSLMISAYRPGPAAFFFMTRFILIVVSAVVVVGGHWSLCGGGAVGGSSVRNETFSRRMEACIPLFLYT